MSNISIRFNMDSSIVLNDVPLQSLNDQLIQAFDFLEPDDIQELMDYVLREKIDYPRDIYNISCKSINKNDHGFIEIKMDILKIIKNPKVTKNKKEKK